MSFYSYEQNELVMPPLFESVLLLIAICFEIVATVSLKASMGLTKFWPATCSVVCYLVAFSLLAFALTRLPVGPVYAVWAGLGTAGASIAGMILYSEKATVGSWAGIVFVIIGVILLGFFGHHEEKQDNTEQTVSVTNEVNEKK
jgi:small multidrug resistance pump